MLGCSKCAALYQDKGKTTCTIQLSLTTCLPYSKLEVKPDNLLPCAVPTGGFLLSCAVPTGGRQLGLSARLTNLPDVVGVFFAQDVVQPGAAILVNLDLAGAHISSVGAGHGRVGVAAEHLLEGCPRQPGGG